MKIDFPTATLKAALSRVDKVIQKRATIPVMQNVAIDADGDGNIVITGSNLDTTISIRCEGHISGSGSFLLPASQLLDMVSAASSDAISMENDGDIVTVKAGRSRLKLFSMERDLYPIAIDASGTGQPVDCTTMSEALAFCLPAASREETRYYLCGVLIDSQPEGMTLWGTNGHIMNRASVSGPHLGVSAIIPYDAVPVIMDALSFGSASMSLTETEWTVSTASLSAKGKTIDGSYPNMTVAINQFSEWLDVIDVDAAMISQAIHIASIGAMEDGQKLRALAVNGSKGDDSLVVRGARSAGGVASAGHAEIEADVMSDASIGVNSALLARVAGCFKGSVMVSVCGSTAIRLSSGDDMESICMATRLSVQEMQYD